MQSRLFNLKNSCFSEFSLEATIFAGMNRTTFGKSAPILGVAALLSAGLLFAQFARISPVASSANSRHFSEKANLALRRTAHHLLAESGDTTSRIPPVQQTDASTWLVWLERPFDYDRLPALLQESFDLHGIRENYDVAVLDCANGELQLGYNFQDFTKKNEVPCGGRELGRGCYNLQVTFLAEESKQAQNPVWWLLACGCLLAGISIAAWQWSNRKSTPKAEAEWLDFGNSRLDIANQLLISGNVRHTLTYREAKLLRLFASHSNQLLERDFILKSVWEDEGIIVGRSVDVFVSRLRKILRGDSAVGIVAVHGVGYRLEVRDERV